MNCSRFVHAMNNTTIINCDDRNITKTKTQHCQIMATIGNKIFKFEHKIKKNNSGTLYTVCCYCFQQNQFLHLNQFYCNIYKTYLSNWKLIFIRLKMIVTNIVYYLRVYSFISTMVYIHCQVTFAFINKYIINKNDSKRFMDK